MEFSGIDRTMMARCIQLARSAAAQGEHPFGSVIANGAEVIAEASNRTVRDAGVERLAAAGDAGEQAVRFLRQTESRQDRCGRAVISA
jgi:tRNA(Arg) A34 adenosine deaminase TadA